MFRSVPLLLAALMVVLLASGKPARAADQTATPSGQCLAAIATAERHQGTPPGLLAVIARVESGRAAPPSGALQPWPWTVDADGQGAFFASKAEAVAWSRQALDSGAVTFLDVGCMQVDLRSHPGAFADLDQAFDPAANAEYGARFLRQLHDGVAGGNWFTAVGYYHSQTPVLAAMYRAQIAAVAVGLPPPRMAVGHLSTTRLDLVGGGVLRINANRQPGRHHRNLTACQISAILASYMPRRVEGCSATKLPHDAANAADRQKAKDAARPPAITLARDAVAPPRAE
jgi:hypothetical protein